MQNYRSPTYGQLDSMTEYQLCQLRLRQHFPEIDLEIVIQRLGSLSSPNQENIFVRLITTTESGPFCKGVLRS